ncbi:MAG: tRNA pseudouridine(38-40) synthase TruA [Tepidisphaeraceae bacterium]
MESADSNSTSPSTEPDPALPPDVPTIRYKLTLAYRGTNYHGWQRQPVPPTWRGDAPDVLEGIPTVQQTLDQTIMAVVQHPIATVGSSRTDAGVHAKGQVVHFDTIRHQIPPHRLRHAINARLPDDVVVRSMEQVSTDFDAIRSTTRKRYQYAVWNAEDRSAFGGDLYFFRWHKIDVDRMRAGAKHFVGTHDYTSFARPGHGRATTTRTVLDCDVSRRGPIIVIGVEGTGFLWNQVRIMAGTLIEVGMGRFEPEDIATMLTAKDRKVAGSTAPAHGLYLQWIEHEMGGQCAVSSVQ